MINLEKLNTKIYNSYFKENMKDGWEDIDKCRNFYHLFQIFEINYQGKEFSILDVGCGTGDIIKYLPNYCKYTGIDIYKPALKLARQQYPNHIFKYKNILSANFKSKFDYIICSGALSIKLKNEDENYKFLDKSLNKMLKFTNKGLSFNLLTDEHYKNSKDSHLFLYNVKKVEKLCKNLTQNVQRVYNPIDEYNDQHTFYLKP